LQSAGGEELKGKKNKAIGAAVGKGSNSNYAIILERNNREDKKRSDAI
jgi:hypothetical protein